MARTTMGKFSGPLNFGGYIADIYLEPSYSRVDIEELEKLRAELSELKLELDESRMESSRLQQLLDQMDELFPRCCHLCSYS